MIRRVAGACAAIVCMLPPVAQAQPQPAPPPAAADVPTTSPAGTPPAPPAAAPAAPAPAADAGAPAADTVEDEPDAPPSAPPRESKELACLGKEEGCQADDLKTPTAPAFAIIGISPTDVETPRSPKALALALYNAYNGGAVAQNVALDVAPYWLVAHPMLTFDEYVNASVGLQLLQNASLSVATAAVPDAQSTDMGVGLRTHFLVTDQHYQQADTTQKALFKLQEIAALKEAQEARGCAGTPAREACVTLASKLAALGNPQTPTDAELAAAGKAVQGALKARSGVLVGVAGAVSSRSAAEEFAPNDYQKAAGWLNVGYRGEWFDVMGLARFTSVDADAKLQFIDLGGKVGAFKPSWGLQVEAVYRAVSGDDPPVDNSGRVAGTFEFKITDEVFASATLGKAADDVAKEGTSFALFGLTFQAGQRRIKSR